MELSRLEQETIILFNEAEPTAEIYTHNKKLGRNWNVCPKNTRIKLR